ncbi:MAG: hypothetical protein GY822_19965 [Deltaproteobacteria bacterium]|nr:hypothetical protein [Deltaproteobacteria bacterium]
MRTQRPNAVLPTQVGSAQTSPTSSTQNTAVTSSNPASNAPADANKANEVLDELTRGAVHQGPLAAPLANAGAPGGGVLAQLQVAQDGMPQDRIAHDSVDVAGAVSA